MERWSQTDPGTSFGSATCRVASGKVHHLSAFSFEMGSTVSASRCSVVRTSERAYTSSDLACGTWHTGRQV